MLMRLLDEAARAVAEVQESHLRAPLLARISALHKDCGPELAAWEARVAVASAEGIDEPYVRSFTLAEVSTGLAATDPLRASSAARAALRTAKTVVDLHSRTIALAEAASAIGAGDRGRAKRILAEAELLADSACSCKRRCLFAAVLERTADLDPEGVLMKVDQIPDLRAKGVVLARIIPPLAGADPQRAMALVRRVPELHEQIQARVALCAALAGTHPELAVSTAEYAAADAAFSHNGLVELNALARVARSVHRADPALAEKLLSAAEAVFERVDPTYSRSLAAGELARAQARVDAERGVRTAQQIVQPHPRAHALVLLAEDFRVGAGS